MAWQGAFHPTTPLAAGRGPVAAGGSSSASHIAPASDNTRWGGFPHQGSNNERIQLPLAGSSSNSLAIRTPGVNITQPATPGPARALVPASSFAPGPVATSSQPQSTSLTTKSQRNQISSNTMSKPTAGASTSGAVVPSTKASATSSTAGAGDMLAQPFTRSLLANRAKWNGLALVGLFILPRLAIVQATTSAALTVVSVLTAGVLDSSLESLGEYGELLAKIVIAINLVDALVRLQSKTAEEKAAAGNTVKSGSADKNAVPRLSFGVRSSPQTRPSPSLALGSSSPAGTPSRAPILVGASLRKTLDEASMLATPSRSPQQLSSSRSSTVAGTGLGSSGRRWPSSSPMQNSLGASNGGDVSKRDISPVQMFRARRAASGRSSGLQFDSSFDAGEDDTSTDSHDVDYGLKVLNSSFSADRSVLGYPAGSASVVR